MYVYVWMYQKSHSFAALTRSISDTSPTRVKIPYAHAFHEVISISGMKGFALGIVLKARKFGTYKKCLLIVIYINFHW